MMTPTLSEMIVRISQMLCGQVHIELSDAAQNGDKPWRCTLHTDGNCYPHWLRWEADTPKEALSACLDYLEGRAVQPHGCDATPPQAFIGNGECSTAQRAAYEVRFHCAVIREKWPHREHPGRRREIYRALDAAQAAQTA